MLCCSNILITSVMSSTIKSNSVFITFSLLEYDVPMCANKILDGAAALAAFVARACLGAFPCNDFLAFYYVPVISIRIKQGTNESNTKNKIYKNKMYTYLFFL